MTVAALNFIKDQLSSLEINYEFGCWSSFPVPYPYFVGEFTEPESMEKEENGFQETTFMITGTGKTWISLIQAKEAIEKNISKTAILPNGSAIAVFYAGSIQIPVDDSELKRIQINLTIKEWSVV